MARRMEKTFTRCENSIGVVFAVARVASRSFRRESRSVDSSADGAGTRLSAEVDLGVGWAPGGFEVASFERLTGRDASAASSSLPWSEQNCRYRAVILSKYSRWAE